MKPLLTMDWVRESKLTIRNKESTTRLTNQSEKDKKITIFERLFKTNRTIEDAEIKKQLK